MMRVALGLIALACLFGGLGNLALAAEELGGTAEEQEVQKAIAAEKYIRGRELAEKILARDAQSFIARYALALAFHEEEGNLSRALYQVQQARQQLIARHGERPDDPLAAKFLSKIWIEEIELLGELDRRAEQLAAMDKYDQNFLPKMDRFRIWPLLKEHRFTEATNYANQAIISADLATRTIGYNGLIAIENERLRPKECYAAGLRALENTGGQSCILYQNTAEAAFSVYQFEEIERLALKSVQAPQKDCPASAYSHLANLYLLRGDYQRAISAARAARDFPVAKRLRQQFEMSNTNWLGSLLFAVGKFERAVELTGQVVVAPDRTGMTSLSFEVLKVIYLVEYHAALMARQEQLREQAVGETWLSRIGTWGKIIRLKQQAWSTRRRITSLLARQDMLAQLVRPYLKPLEPWNTGALIDVVGEGVLSKAIAQARVTESMPKETAPYFAALEGEIAFRRGDWPLALAQSTEALAKLPAAEALLRGRVAAYGAAAAWRLGQHGLGEKLFHETLLKFPTALRIFGLGLPARLMADQTPLAQRTAKKLLSSPRLMITEEGFVVRVSQIKQHLQICLEGRRGQQYSCAFWETSAQKTGRENIAATIDKFHEQVFAPRVDLTQHDINSLDGSTVRGDIDDVLKQVFDK